MVAARPAAAGFLTGGNAITSRPLLDFFRNFSIVDKNNAINLTGEVTSWDIYAGATTPVELEIFRQTGPTSYILVGSGPLVTPVLGANHFDLPTPISVQAGDLVGYYTQDAGVAEYQLDAPGVNNFGPGNLTGTMLFTADNSGPGANFFESSNRTYSIDVTGIAAPAPGGMILLAAAGLTLGCHRLARSRRRRWQLSLA
jgi:hypothetical protein